MILPALILCSILADAFNLDCKTPELSASLTIAINSSRNGGHRKCKDSCINDSAILKDGFLCNCCKSVCFKNRNLRAVALYSCDEDDEKDDDEDKKDDDEDEDEKDDDDGDYYDEKDDDEDEKDDKDDEDDDDDDEEEDGDEDDTYSSDNYYDVIFISSGFHICTQPHIGTCIIYRQTDR